MSALITRRPIVAAVAERLTGVTNATGYVGAIGAMNGLPGVTSTPAQPPTKSADDKRVQPYFVLYPGIGGTVDEQDLADTLVDIDYPVAITAAAGDVNDLLALVDRITALLWRWAPTDLPPVAGRAVVAGPLRYPPGYAPPLLTDAAFTPARQYTQLQFVTTVHT